MMVFSCTIPTIEFGVGKSEELPVIVKRFGAKVLLALDPYLDQNGYGDEVVNHLKRKNISAIKFSEITPNPSCFGIDKAAKIAREEGSQVIVAIGGGSAIDFGKGVAVVATHSGASWQYTERKDHEVLRPTAETLPIIALPTTSGTGSEVTHYAVFNNPEMKEKSTLISEHVMPKVALVDPALTYSAPPTLTAHTGIDVLAHAVESYIGLNASTVSKLVSREAVELVFKYLPVAVANGQNVEARDKMAWASTLAGIGIVHGGVALPHAIGQPVSGLLGAPHGGSIAACIGRILEISYIADLQGFAELAEAMDPTISSLSQRAKAEKCPELVTRLLNDTNSAARFSDFGMNEGDIDKVTNIALTGYYFDIESNPKKVTTEEIKQIYRDCL